MFVYILRFQDRSAVERAYGVVSDDVRVESCLVEIEELRIRFMADGEAGPALVEKVYERGGLVWSTRSAVEKPKTATE